MRGIWAVIKALLLFLVVSCVYSKTAEEWRTRVIYQVLTDRFAPTGPAPSEPCDDLRSYCGGTFTGIRQRLPYIKSLGANAIWLSPFVENTEGGYHGYWAKNLYLVNPHFGTAQDLHDLVTAAHAADVWVMMDIVVNHMGYPVGSAFNFTDFVPFNQPEHYHDFCQIKDFKDQKHVEECRLAGLPDLNETVSFVRRTLLSWIQDIHNNYGFDGYRIDTVTEMPKSWWREFSSQVGGAMMMGEANNGDDTCYTGAYQGPLPSVLNFPTYWALRRAFTALEPMTGIAESLREQRRCFSDTSVLGLFVDNHDFPRFLALQDDAVLLANALAYVILGEGIPVIYYGTEQAFFGKGDPENRESLWPHYHQTSSTYRFIQSLTALRRGSDVDLTSANQVELHADNDTLVFARGDQAELLVVLSNVGRYRALKKTVTDLYRTMGHEYVNAFNDKDLLQIHNGNAVIDLPDGMPKVYIRRALPSEKSQHHLPYGGW